MNKTSCLTRRVMSLLMALLLVVGMAGRTVFPAVTAEASSLFDDYVQDNGSINENAGGDGAGGFETVISQYKTIAVAITGILTITMVAAELQVAIHPKDTSIVWRNAVRRSSSLFQSRRTTK